MGTSYENLYDAKPFGDDPGDHVAERARRALLDAYGAALQDTELGSVVEAMRSRNESDVPWVMAGIMVGLCQIVVASAEGERDDVDRACRSSIRDMAAWVVDTARNQEGLPPLVEVH